MDKAKKEELSLLITRCNKEFSVIKGVDVKKNIKKVIITYDFDYDTYTASNINRLIYDDNSMITFNTYEELIAYLKGCNEMITNIKINKQKG